MWTKCRFGDVVADSGTSIKSPDFNNAKRADFTLLAFAKPLDFFIILFKNDEFLLVFLEL